MVPFRKRYLGLEASARPTHTCGVTQEVVYSDNCKADRWRGRDLPALLGTVPNMENLARTPAATMRDAIHTCRMPPTSELESPMPAQTLTPDEDEYTQVGLAWRLARQLYKLPDKLYCELVPVGNLRVKRRRKANLRSPRWFFSKEGTWKWEEWQGSRDLVPVGNLLAKRRKKANEETHEAHEWGDVHASEVSLLPLIYAPMPAQTLTPDEYRQVGLASRLARQLYELPDIDLYESETTGILGAGGAAAGSAVNTGTVSTVAVGRQGKVRCVPGQADYGIVPVIHTAHERRELIKNHKGKGIGKGKEKDADEDKGTRISPGYPSEKYTSAWKPVPSPHTLVRVGKPPTKRKKPNEETREAHEKKRRAHLLMPVGNLPVKSWRLYAACSDSL